MNAKKSFQVKTPWLAFCGDVPAHLDYPDCTLYEAVERCAQKYPDYPAYVFMGRRTSYRTMVQEIDLCARALKAIGVRAGDRVTVALPNCPQAVTAFYAINLVGAIANMIHPLSSEKEIEFYLKESGSLFAITLDQFTISSRPSARTWTWTISFWPPSRTPCPSRSRPATCSPRGGRWRRSPRTPLSCGGTNSCAGPDLPLEVQGGEAGGGCGGHPLLRRHHRHHQGHFADQPELQRPGHPGAGHQPHVPPRGQDAGGDARCSTASAWASPSTPC